MKWVSSPHAVSTVQDVILRTFGHHGLWPLCWHRRQPGAWPDGASPGGHRGWWNSVPRRTWHNRPHGKLTELWENHGKSGKLTENHGKSGKIMGKLWKIHHFSWNQLFTYGPFAIAKCNKVPEGTPISCHCPICSCIFPLTCAFVQTLSLFNLHDFAIWGYVHPVSGTTMLMDVFGGAFVALLTYEDLRMRRIITSYIVKQNVIFFGYRVSVYRFEM